MARASWRDTPNPPSSFFCSQGVAGLIPYKEIKDAVTMEAGSAAEPSSKELQRLRSRLGWSDNMKGTTLPD